MSCWRVKESRGRKGAPCLCKGRALSKPQLGLLFRKTRWGGRPLRRGQRFGSRKGEMAVWLLGDAAHVRCWDQGAGGEPLCSPAHSDYLCLRHCVILGTRRQMSDQGVLVVRQR